MSWKLESGRMTDVLVEVSGLSKRFGPHLALDACSLQIRRGEVFGLLGPNGAGKTTLIRMLMGFLRPTAGTATVEGLDCFHQRIEVHRRAAYLPGDARLFRSMTGRQVLKFFADVRADGDFGRALEIAERLELELSRWVAFMSTGMRQKLALAAVLSVPASLTILDEPTANLDPTVRGRLLEMIASIRESGRTVIFSSHVMSEVEEVCDRVGILRAGRLVHQQSMEELRRWYRIEGRMVEDPASGFAGTRDMPAAGGRGERLAVALAELEGLAEQVQVDVPTGRLSFVVRDRLPTALEWLARHRVQDLEVVRNGLRAVYDRYHGGSSGESAA